MAETLLPIERGISVSEKIDIQGSSGFVQSWCYPVDEKVVNAIPHDLKSER